MKPLLFQIKSFTVYTYGMVMVTAFILCFVVAWKTRPKHLLSKQDLLNFCLLTMAALLFGTKLMELIFTRSLNSTSLLHLLKFWEKGKFSFFPALILAVLLIYIYCIIKKISFLEVMDYLLLPAILGISIQRCCGCFAAGCCYGKPTTLPWGIVFPPYSPAGQHYPFTPLHPTQLYYGLTALVIYIALRKYKQLAPPKGEITGFGLVMISLTYFFITFWRGDKLPRELIYHLTLSQYLALALFATGVIVLILVNSRTPGTGLQPLHYRTAMHYSLYALRYTGELT